MTIAKIIPVCNRSIKTTNFVTKSFDSTNDDQNSFELLPRFKLTTLPEDELGEYELELLSKASKWHIPHDKHNPDFSTLEDDVCSYESLIKQTSGLDINWDYNCYDPIGLEQAIFDAEERESGYSRAEYWDYYTTKGVQ